MKKILVTFDIDGTLINCPNGLKVQRSSFIKAFSDIFPNDHFLDNYFDTGNKIGVTDKFIARNIISKHNGCSSHQIEQLFLEKYDYHYLKSNFELPQLTPNITQIISILKHDKDVIIGLVTGNTKDTAKFKLEKAGLLQNFDPLLGGFGDNITRVDCLKTAIKNAKQYLSPDTKLKCIHVGDTTSDIESAIIVGAVPIGVKTGKGRQKYTNNMDFFIDSFEKDPFYLSDLIEDLKQRE